MNYLNLAVCSLLGVAFLASAFTKVPFESVGLVPGLVFGICFFVLAGLSFFLLKQK